MLGDHLGWGPSHARILGLGAVHKRNGSGLMPGPHLDPTEADSRPAIVSYESAQPDLLAGIGKLAVPGGSDGAVLHAVSPGGNVCDRQHGSMTGRTCHAKKRIQAIVFNQEMSPRLAGRVSCTRGWSGCAHHD